MGCSPDLEPDDTPAGTNAPRPEADTAATSAPVNRDLLLPYLAPYAAFVLVGALAGGLGHEVDYALRLGLTGGLLLVFAKRYARLTGPRSAAASAAWGVGAGILGVGLWIALLLPFKGAGDGVAFSGSAFALRLAAATLVVPFAEEMLCRGYLLGLVTQWQQARREGADDPFSEALDRRSVASLSPGAWTWLAIAVSSAAFAVGHPPAQMLGAFGYGLLMAGLYVLRKDLVAPIVAHATTNLTLYVYVYLSGSWGFW